MRILVTADLHYDSPRSRPAAREMAERICRTGGDAIVLVGDCAGAAHGPLRECLGLFERFAGLRLLVPGNHCLWCLPGEDSLVRYQRTVPAIAREAGFTVLDRHPQRLGAVGLVGSVGWYDYSYRDEALGIPLEFYRAKVAPGAAARLTEHRALAEAHRAQLAEELYQIGTRWMDGVHMRMEMTDRQFLDYLLRRLRRQLRAMQDDPAVRRVAAFVHHLPFRQLVPRDRPPQLAFAAAYMGSDRIGRALRSFRKVRHVLCGHSHWKGACRIGRLEVINVGSTYLEKHLEVLDL